MRKAITLNQDPQFVAEVINRLNADPAARELWESICGGRERVGGLPRCDEVAEVRFASERAGDITDALIARVSAR